MQRRPAWVSRLQESVDRLFSSERFLPCLILIVVAVLWLVPLPSSLWRDEAASWWVVKDGLSVALQRSARFQSWAPLYFLIEWADVAMFGSSELALRIPSVAAMAGAALLLFSLARSWFDTETALLSTLVFAASQEVSFAAADARPYAVALFLMLAAMHSLRVWLDTGRPVRLAAFVLLASLMVYAHLMFAASFTLFALYGFLSIRPGMPATRRQFSVAAAAIGLLVSPLAVRILALSGDPHSLVWAGVPSWAELGWALAPPALVCGALLGLIIALPFGATPGKAPPCLAMRLPATAPAWAGPLIMLGAWGIAAPLGFFALAHATPLKFFVARYMLWFTAGRALLFGWSLSMVEPVGARRAVALALALGALVSYGNRMHSFEDLRGACAAVRDTVSDDQTPVLLQSPYVESLQVGWLSDQENIGYLLSPLTYYPLRGRIIPLPLRRVPWADEYMEDIAARVLTPSGRFLLVVLRGGGKSAYHSWVEDRLGAAGYSLTALGKTAGTAILVFDRPAPAALSPPLHSPRLAR